MLTANGLHRSLAINVLKRHERLKVALTELQGEYDAFAGGQPPDFVHLLEADRFCNLGSHHEGV